MTDTWLPSFKQISILYFLYTKCANPKVGKGRITGRFTGLKELAAELGCCQKSMLNMINEMAEHELLDILYVDTLKKKRGVPAKSFSIPCGKALSDILRPFTRECENALITCYNLTGNTSLLENIKF